MNKTGRGCFEKGHVPWNKGAKGKQTFSLETREKMRLSHINKMGTNGFLGKHHNEETRNLIGLKHKGKKCNFYIDGRTLKKYFCKDCRKKINYQSIYRGNGRCSSCANIYKWKDEEYRKKTSKNISNRAKDRCSTLEERQKLLERAKLGWKKLRVSPNIIEQKLEILLNKLFSNQYKYVGNCNFFVKNFNPDFINTNHQKKIIELYGDYWHKLPGSKERDKNRLNTYKKYGYKTLIVWEHEFKDKEKLTEKLIKFNEGL